MLVKTDLWQYDRIATHVWVTDEHIPDSSVKLYYAIDIDLTENESAIADNADLGIKNDIIRDDTAQAGSTSSTINLDAGASGDNDAYNGYQITIDGGTGAGQTRKIIDYDGGTKVATITPDWDTTPDNTSTFQIKAVHLRIITGRPDFDGIAPHPTYEGGADNPYEWAEGIFTEMNLGASSSSIDVGIMGNVATLSGFKFGIKDCQKQYQNINKNDTYFTSRPITHYIIIGDVFYAIWSGIISDVFYKDEEVAFSCEGAFNVVHKEMPQRSAIPPEFTNVPDADSGKSIPVCIGDIPFAQIVLVDKQFNQVDITNVTGREYFAGAWEYTTGANIYSKFTFISWDKNFSSGDLIGYYLRVAGGGGNVDKNRLYQIYSSSPSVLTYLYSTVLQKYTTGLYLTEQLSDYNDISTNFNSTYKADFNPANYPYSLSDMGNYWNINIFEFLAEYRFSNLPIETVLNNALGVPYIRIWNEQLKAFQDISKLFEYSDITDGKLKLKPKLLEGENSARYNVYIKPDIDEIVSAVLRPDYETDLGLWTPVPNQTLTGTADLLTDKDRTTYVEATHVSGTFKWAGFAVRINNNDELKLAAQGGTLGLAIDATLINDPAVTDYELSIMPVGIDSYQQLISSDPAEYRFAIDPNHGREIEFGSGQWNPFNMLEDDYYAYGGDDNGEGNVLPISVNTHDGIKYVHEMKHFSSEFTSLIADETIVQVVLFIMLAERGAPAPTGTFSLRVKQISFVQTSSVAFENDNTTVQVSGEKYDGNETNNLYRGLQHIIHNYDGIATTDADFNNLNTTRNAWHIGRQIQDKKSSLEYIKELCQHGFVGYWQDRNAALNFKSWVDDKSIAAFHDDNEVLRDTIKGFKYDSLRNAYNEFSIRYGYNNITGNYEKELYITNVQQNQFPSSGDDTWKQFVGGISDHTTAKALWDDCHAAYLKTLLVQKFVIDCPWYIDGTKFTGAPTGTNESAYKFLALLVAWATHQKEIVEYEVYLNPSTLVLDMFDYISFKDTHLTDSVYRGGWIIGISNNPKSNTRRITLLIDPDPS